MNVTVLIGRVTAEPNVTWKNDLCIASLSMAVDRQKEGADFPMVKAFGKVAELIEKYVHKGDMLGVKGHIQTGKYENKETHRMVYTTDVVAEEIQFLSQKQEEQERAF